MEFHPLAEEYELLEGQDLEDMADDIEARGQQNPIILYEDKILDGRNRFNSCKLRGIEPKFDQLPDGEDPVRYIMTHNDYRRHDAKSSKRKARIKRIREMKNNGMSNRSIGKAEGIDEKQVRMDLEETNGKANGHDSHNCGGGGPQSKKKTQMARKPKEEKPKKPKPKDINKKIQEEKLSTPELLDNQGEVVPPGLAPIFSRSANFAVIGRELTNIAKSIKELKDTPAGDFLHIQEITIEIRNVKEAIKFAAPYAVCPQCKGIAKGRKANCQCKQRGWMTKSHYDAMPQEWRS